MVIFRLFIVPVALTRAEILEVVFDDGFSNALSDDPSLEGTHLYFPDDQDPYNFLVEGAEVGGCEDEVKVWVGG
jgi:hypothetical protein